MYKKYLPERVERGDYIPTSLEVRNDGWTEEKIKVYLEYLHHRFNYLFEQFDNDIDEIAKYFFDKNSKHLFNHDNFDLITRFHHRDGISTCSIQKSLVIRLSDLSIVPCHRLTYHQFLGGWFKVENDKIIGLKPNNVGQLINFKTFRYDLAPECCVCWNREHCLFGCLGSQFEWSGEVYLPILSVCDLQKAKTSFILKLFAESGVLASAINQNLLKKEHRENLEKLCERFKYQIRWKNEN